jgi:hypothetical protein
MVVPLNNMILTIRGMDNILNKNNFFVANVQENSSKDVATLNMLTSYLSSSPQPINVNASTIEFRVSKHVTMRRGITTFKSYL